MEHRALGPYQGCKVAFPTKHGKQNIVRKPLELALGCEIVHTDRFDTDHLGTFTRDIARAGWQLDAARKKAQLGMELTHASVGLASEGAFGPDPYAGMVEWNTELLLWVDKQRGIELTGIAQGPAQSMHRLLKDEDELDDFARIAMFPEHFLVLRPAHQDLPHVYKDITTANQLRKAFAECQARSTNGLVFAENDLRAFSNPTRQALIAKALCHLMDKLRSLCPRCDSPGFWIKDLIAGLPCRICKHETRLPIAELWYCNACAHTENRPRHEGQWADPGRCDHCNP